MNIAFPLALALAALSGLIALIYEIIWARVYSFTSGSRAVALGTMLGSYLIGLAIGSLLSRKWQDALVDRQATLRKVSDLILLSNLIAFLVIPLISWSVVYAHWIASLPLVIVGATFLGTVLPLVCHAAIPADESAGAHMSYIYIANIIGSGLGSLGGGFLLLEFLSLWQIELLLLLLAVVSSALLVCLGSRPRRSDYGKWAFILIFAFTAKWVHQGLYERLQYLGDYRNKVPFVDVVETRHGVITVDGHKTIFGGGVYDGMIEVRPLLGGGLLRPYFASAVHPRPEKVLVIGMSGGAWTQILANHPQVQSVTAVEINGGYLKIIRKYPDVSTVLTNPKVTIHIDDGRRWLRRNPDQKFDLVVMNTSFHWREFSSALLGREFLELVKSRLEPNGVVMWNLTGSARAASTAMKVFPYTLMVANNCVASTSPLNVDLERWRGVLSAFRIDGQLMFDRTTDEGRQNLEAMISAAIPGHPTYALTTQAEMQKKFAAAPEITDDNLGEEYNFNILHHPVLTRLALRFR